MHYNLQVSMQLASIDMYTYMYSIRIIKLLMPLLFVNRPKGKR